MNRNQNFILFLIGVIVSVRGVFARGEDASEPHFVSTKPKTGAPILTTDEQQIVKDAYDAFHPSKDAVSSKDRPRREMTTPSRGTASEKNP